MQEIADKMGWKTVGDAITRLISIAEKGNYYFKLYEKMEKLSIKYFDTHTHGDIMSLYTNDTDTLRELLSNSLPNIISNTLTIIGMIFMNLIIWIMI